MHPAIIIFKEEYIRKFKSKSFLIGTLLTPIAIFLLIFASIYFTSYQTQHYNIAVLNNSNLSLENLKSRKNFTYFIDSTIDKENFVFKAYDALVVLPRFDTFFIHTPEFYSKSQIGVLPLESIERDIASAIESAFMHRLGFSVDTINYIKNVANHINFETYLVENKNNDQQISKKTNSKVASTIGYISSFLMYIIVLLYGVMIMRSVMEEKTSRVVEILISSVKPLHLMIGKIFSHVALALSQIGIWIAILLVSVVYVLPLIAKIILPETYIDINHSNGSPKDMPLYTINVI